VTNTGGDDREHEPVTDGSSLSDDLGSCLVTGAAGLVGRNLTRALLARGCRVRALVHNTPLALEHRNLECLSGDVRDASAMLKASEGVATVFHTAALLSFLGGSSATEAYRRPAWEINVIGTENLLRACRDRRVRRFVYTSSVDVCFEGKPVENMDQSTPYAKRPRSVYGETKIAAEKMVLAANGEGGVFTCAIRADGIYGPEENLLLDSIVKQAAAGRLTVAIGSADTLQDNSYIDNLIHGEILAARHLSPGGSACGKAYFITDYTPQNMFEFFRPLIEGMGFTFPTRRIPAGWLRPVLTLWEHLHFRLGTPPPLVTPYELDKVTVTHYGSIRDAKRDLGYKPVKTYEQAMKECLPYCRDLLEKIRNKRKRKA
jgi:3beta-hydroxy-Delta5-steroid dehydrogenase / steroid Delta-isomerase